MSTPAPINIAASFGFVSEGTLLGGWQAPPQESNPFHFEDSQVVLQVSHNIASYAPILLNPSSSTGRGKEV